MNKSSKLGYYIGEGFRSIFKHGFMSFASITVIVACLLIMGCFSLLALNVADIVDDLMKETETIAFVNEEFTEEQAREIEPLLLAVPNVRSVQFVSREMAMDDFVSDYDSDIFRGLDVEVFRDRYVVFVEDLEKLEQTQLDIADVAGIADVNAHLTLSENFITVRNIVAIVSIALVLMLFIISMFIMANTIKLTTYERREEIAIMKMVGATNSFIRWPFFFEGMLLGVTGSLIAFMLQWAVYMLVTEKLLGNVGAFSLIQPISFGAICIPMAIVFIAVGFIVGMFGSLTAIRNYLRV